MVYGKLELNTPERGNAAPLQASGKFVLKLFRASLVVCAVLLLIKIVALNTAPRTYPLTNIPSIGDENGMQFAFWLSLFVSFFSAQAKTIAWPKKLLHIFGFFLANIIMSMLVLMTLSDFNERRLFSRVYAPSYIETFRVIDINLGRKGHRKAVVTSPKYDLEPSIWVERSAYDFLETHKDLGPKSSGPETPEHSRAHLFNTCVDLPIQRSGQYARIRLENKLAIRNFYSC
jgi:hypothetical protein